jgi:hypothetical protein
VLELNELQLGETLVGGNLVEREARLDLLTNLLHQIFHEQLGVGLHGTELFLAVGEVSVLFQTD